MRHIQRFLAALFTVILVASCSDSPTGNDFEPIRYGSFLQVSDTRLDWIGNGSMKSTAQTSAKGDTTFFEAPDGNSLRIDYVQHEGQNPLFGVVYVDSSYSFAYFDTTDANAEVTGYDPFDPNGINGAIGASEEHMQATITINNFSCDSTYNLQEDDDFEFHILDDNGGIYESIIVDSDGVEQAMRAVGC